MSDYNIPPKPKVSAGSASECRTFGRTLAECCMLEWVAWNCCSKKECERAHIFWDGKLRRKTSVYRPRTKDVSKSVLLVNYFYNWHSFCFTFL